MNVSDPYNVEEANPIHTGALDSSLWEIVSHRQHYHSAVATLARIFEAAFTRQAYAMEDFLDHTYATVSISIFTTPRYRAADYAS